MSAQHKTRPMRIAIVANTAWYIANFRLGFMRSLRAAGYQVSAICPAGEGLQQIADAGFDHFAFKLEGKSINPLRELGSVLSLRSALKQAAPDVILSHTPKGNIYASFARRGLGIRQIAGVSGLGSSFIRQDWLTRIVMQLYKLTFGGMDRVFFENPTDQGIFLQHGLVSVAQAQGIPGLGVDLAHFASVPVPQLTQPGAPVFLMIARLLGDKGVREYAAAAHAVRLRHAHARFQLLGSLDASNPTAITADELANWTSDGTIDYLGYTADVRPYIAAAHCVVLPSYREGMSRTLLEAAAVGRALVASDVPGCREAIDVGVNGLLCEARSTESLSAALAQICTLPEARLIQMGEASRSKAQAQFSEAMVTATYLRSLEQLRR